MTVPNMPTDESKDKSEILRWAEEVGLQNLKYHHENATSLVSEASTTLTLVLASLGGSLVYAVRVFEPSGLGAVSLGAAVLCSYLAAVAVLLVFNCLRIRPLPPVYNEPLHLAQTSFSMDALRGAELQNIQERIKEVVKRNERTAKRLNWLRTAAIASPLVFVAGAAIGSAVGRGADSTPRQVLCEVAPAASSPSHVRVVCTLPKERY